MKVLLLIACIGMILLLGCVQNKHSKQLTRQQQPSEHVVNNVQGANEKRPVAGKVNSISATDFQQWVMNYKEHPQEWVFNGTKPAIIDFYATWCGPCKMTAPVVEELAKEYAGKIDFYKVDIDQEAELADVFGIQSVPTFLFVPVTGNPTMQLGAMQKDDFERIIKKVLLK